MIIDIWRNALILIVGCWCIISTQWVKFFCWPWEDSLPDGKKVQRSNRKAFVIWRASRWLGDEYWHGKPIALWTACYYKASLENSCREFTILFQDSVFCCRSHGDIGLLLEYSRGCQGICNHPQLLWIVNNIVTFKLFTEIQTKSKDFAPNQALRRGLWYSLLRRICYF